MNPLISVIIPCYNRADMVGEAMDSILQQDYKHHEIIVVNDGSTDDLESALSPYLEKIIYLDKKKNEGVSAARNDGVKISTGRYITFLDSDDVWLPNKSKSQLELLEKNNASGMAVGACSYIDINQNPILSSTYPLKSITYNDLAIFTAIPGSTSNVLIRKSVLDDVGCFDTDIHAGEDRDLWMRIAYKYPISIVSEPTVLIRVHDTERVNRSYDIVLENRKAINQKIINSSLKRKADAWLYFCIYNNFSNYPAYKLLYFLFLSIFTYPFKIHPQLSRLRPFLENLRKGRLTPSN